MQCQQTRHREVALATIALHTLFITLAGNPTRTLEALVSLRSLYPTDNSLHTPSIPCLVMVVRSAFSQLVEYDFPEEYCCRLTLDSLW